MPTKMIIRKLTHVKKSYIVYAILIISVTANVISFVSINKIFTYSDKDPPYDGLNNHLKNLFPNGKIPHEQERHLVNELANIDENNPRNRKRFQGVNEKLAKYNFAGENVNLQNNFEEVKFRNGPTSRKSTWAITREYPGPNSKEKKYQKFKRKESKNKRQIITNPKSSMPLFRVVTDSDKSQFSHGGGYDRYHHYGIFNTTDNEMIRNKYLVIHSKSKNTQNFIWFHRKFDNKNPKKFSQEDGILEQMNYVPRSYVSRLKSLGLMDHFGIRNDSHFSERAQFKLDEYLLNEFEKTVHKTLSRKDLQPVTWEGFKKSFISIRTNYLPINRNRNKHKPDWTSLLKIIYVLDSPSEDVKIGRQTFLHEKCPVSSCYVTNSPIFGHVAHVTVIQDSMAPISKKPQGQIWINRVLEAPVNTFVQGKLRNLLNWTATYRWDSTIVTPYSKFVSNSEIVRYQHVLDEFTNVNAQKTHNTSSKTFLVAWFASNCLTDNKRYDYVTELKKYIPVDIYGDCGKLKCKRREEKNCFEMLSREYKFYLSFENSNCDYYITEKLFLNALTNDIVPVVMGARKEDYIKAAPPNSFISVEDFPDAQSLAEYLQLLDRNSTLYNSYLAWKGTGQFINTKFWCRVCALVQDDDKPVMWYEQFSDWWLHPGACRRGRWNGVG